MDTGIGGRGTTRVDAISAAENAEQFYAKRDRFLHLTDTEYEEMRSFPRFSTRATFLRNKLKDALDDGSALCGTLKKGLEIVEQALRFVESDARATVDENYRAFIGDHADVIRFLRKVDGADSQISLLEAAARFSATTDEETGSLERTERISNKLTTYLTEIAKIETRASGSQEPLTNKGTIELLISLKREDLEMMLAAYESKNPPDPRYNHLPLIIAARHLLKTELGYVSDSVTWELRKPSPEK